MCTIRTSFAVTKLKICVYFEVIDFGGNNKIRTDFIVKMIDKVSLN